MLNGAKAIGEFLSCGRARIHALRAAGAPIASIGGRLLADSETLRAWVIAKTSKNAQRRA